jgi:hypothetical protein
MLPFKQQPVVFHLDVFQRNLQLLLSEEQMTLLKKSIAYIAGSTTPANLSNLDATIFSGSGFIYNYCGKLWGEARKPEQYGGSTQAADQCRGRAKQSPSSRA